MDCVPNDFFFVRPLVQICAVLLYCYADIQHTSHKTDDHIHINIIFLFFFYVIRFIGWLSSSSPFHTDSEIQIWNIEYDIFVFPRCKLTNILFVTQNFKQKRWKCFKLNFLSKYAVGLITSTKTTYLRMCSETNRWKFKNIVNFSRNRETGDEYFFFFLFTCT